MEEKVGMYYINVIFYNLIIYTLKYKTIEYAMSDLKNEVLSSLPGAQGEMNQQMNHMLDQDEDIDFRRLHSIDNAYKVYI